MSRLIKKEHRIEWIVGAVTVVIAIVMILVIVWLLGSISFPASPPTTSPTTTHTTQPTLPPKPLLIPNPYGPGDFSYENGYLHCVAGKSSLGVDVSEYQGWIDWPKVSEAGVEIAMIRLGCRA